MLTDSSELHRSRQAAIHNRRHFRLPGYVCLSDLGLDGDWVSPSQITSDSMVGPCLLAYHWLDAATAREHLPTLKRLGYLPSMPFNMVLDMALSRVGLQRNEIYVTQAFHLLPTSRSTRIPRRDLYASFRQIALHELLDRPVIALGNEAYQACVRHGINAERVVHPSARTGTYAEKANEIARALRAVLSKSR
jgi:hypothetical protein